MLECLKSRKLALEVQAEECRDWKPVRQSAAMVAIDWVQVPELVLRQAMKQPVQLRGRRQVLLLVQVQEQKPDQE